MHVTIEAEASAALLCRLIGLAAQLDLPAPPMRVSIVDHTMFVDLDLIGLERHLAAILAEKMARCIGVTTIGVDGVPLDVPTFAGFV